MTEVLIVNSIVCWIVATAVLCLIVRLEVAAPVAAVKILVPFVYFLLVMPIAWNPGGADWTGWTVWGQDDWKLEYLWTLVDSKSYFDRGIVLRETYGVWDSLFSSDGRLFLWENSGNSYHVFYGWFNALIQQLGGVYPSNPILVNVVITFFSAYFLFVIARTLNFGSIYAAWLALFYLLSAEVVSWSSFENLKDTIVMFLLMGTCAVLVKLNTTRQPIWFLLLAISLLSFLFIRMYLPALILLSVFVWAITQENRKQAITIMLTLLVASITYWYFVEARWISKALGRMDWGELPIGFIKMLITPRPWSVSQNYSFITIAAYVHWLLLVPALLGGFALWKKSREVRFFLILFIVVLAFYGIFEGYSGPRHRYPVMFVMLWMQFHFIWVYFLSKREAALSLVVRKGLLVV